MLILAETAAGYAVFRAKDKILKKAKKGENDSIYEYFENTEKLTSSIKLEAFEKFENTAEALENVAAIIDGKATKKLSKFILNLEEKSGPFMVADPKLGNAIDKILGNKFDIISNSTTAEFYRGIKEHLSELVENLAPSTLKNMSLGLSHSFSRHKLRFSPDKIDTMIIQAIALLDDLDKELNIYIMRCKEWYGWHFPEMTKIIQDNLAYVKCIKAMGMRTNAVSTDFSSILPVEFEHALKSAAEISMGTEITDEDLSNILHLSDQIIDLTGYRLQLSEYLRNRMQAIAPNLTTLVGEVVGARLIAHAGSLLNLAKHPASTIQILGAEKALFRALKTKHDTPKYGLIYHASLVGQANNKIKGKIARIVATKAALSLRYDALCDNDEGNYQNNDVDGIGRIGLESRLKIEARLRALGEGNTNPKEVSSQTKGRFEIEAINQYNSSVDIVSSKIDDTKDYSFDNEGRQYEIPQDHEGRKLKKKRKMDPNNKEKRKKHKSND